MCYLYCRLQDSKYCANVSLVHGDVQIQTEANHLFVFSSLCLLLPSIPISLWLGSLCDVWSAKISIIIPLIGLIIGDINYILQTVWFELHPYLLLISDLAFGLTGGFSGLIGMMFAYRMKQRAETKAGNRMAILEGSMGLGTSAGYAISGVLRRVLGFPGTFSFLLAVRLIIIIYVAVFLEEIKPEMDLSSNRRPYLQPLDAVRKRLADAFRVLYEERPSRKILILSLIALSFSLFSSSGMNNILFSFFRFKLGWDDRQYGWYNGLRYMFSTIAVLSIYPLIQRRGVSDMRLCFAAIIIKMINVIGIGFVFSTYFAFILTIFTTADRFIPTALRASASQSVDLSEQGSTQQLKYVLNS